MPCLDVDIITLYYYRPGSTPICLCFSGPPETQIPFGQVQLTKVGHSIDSGIFHAPLGLSMCCSTDTTHVNMLAIDGEFLSCSVDAGFILALPLHHGDLAV